VQADEKNREPMPETTPEHTEDGLLFQPQRAGPRSQSRNHEDEVVAKILAQRQRVRERRRAAVLMSSTGTTVSRATIAQLFRKPAKVRR